MSQEQLKIRFAYLPITQALPLFVALEEQSFKKEDLNVEAMPLENPNAIIDLLLSKHVDFVGPGAATGAALIAQSKFPESFKIFGFQGGAQHNSKINDCLIVKKDSYLKTWRDLKGKKLGIVPGIQWKTYTKHILNYFNLNSESDLQIVELPVGMQLSGLSDGKVDAVLALDPVTSVGEKLGIVKIIDKNPAAKYICEPFLGGSAIVSNRFLINHPETAKKVIKIIDMATKKINSNFDQYEKLIMKYAPIGDWQLGVANSPLFITSDEIGKNEIEAAKKLASIFKIEGLIDGEINFDNLILNNR